MRSAVITIIKLDLDTSTDRRQVKLKRLSYNLRQADWKKLLKELIKTKPSSLSSNPKKATTEFMNWSCEKAIPRTNINGWQEIT